MDLIIDLCRAEPRTSMYLRVRVQVMLKTAVRVGVRVGLGVGALSTALWSGCDQG